MKRRNFLELGIGGLSTLLMGRNLFADEPTRDIRPSLEEIAILIKKEPNEILKPAMENREIRKFEYTRQTTPDDMYKILKDQFHSSKVLVYITDDIPTTVKNKNRSVAGTGNKNVESGAAISFLYMALNLQRMNKDVGFLFLELKDFYGEENWAELGRLFNTRNIEFPSFAEFIRDSSGRYKFSNIGGCGVKSPQKIFESIDWGVDRYSKTVEEMLKSPF